MEIVEFEPDRHFAIRGDLGPLTGTLSYDLDAVDGGTVVINTADLEGRGVLKVAAPIAGSRIRDAVGQSLQVLKQLLEDSNTA